MSACVLGGARENCVGFCGLHRCNMTARQVKRRKCLKKQCRHLRRYQDHPYWAGREAKNEIRKARKKARQEGTV